MKMIDYNDKFFILFGAERKHIETIKQLNGRWDSSLGGWFFSNQHRVNVEEMIKNSPVMEVTTETVSERLSRKKHELSRYLLKVEELKREISILERVSD